jgi:hypothetical protein
MLITTVTRTILRYYKQWRIVVMLYRRHERGIMYRYFVHPDGVNQEVQSKHRRYRRRYILQRKGQR